MYIDVSYIDIKSRVYFKNIDYNIRYAYSVNLPSYFAYSNYSKTQAYYYKPMIDLHDNYLLISHNFPTAPPSFNASFNNQTQYEIFSFNGQNSMVKAH